MDTGGDGRSIRVGRAPDLGTQLEDLFCSVWECEDLVRFENRIGLAVASARSAHEPEPVLRDRATRGH